MDWIKRFDLFLFDFDGLLVNTEELHFAAYKKMCSDRGCELRWDFKRFCSHSHFQSQGIKEAIEEDFPNLMAQAGGDWKILYDEKKRAYLELLKEGAVALMPGVADLLTRLQKENKRRCVVTNSPQEQIDFISGYLPLLKTIPLWVTREDYTRPKPHPEGYLTALKKLAQPHDRIIGFEDTHKGLQALQGVPCHPVIISTIFKPDPAVSHFESFDQIRSDLLLESNIKKYPEALILDEH